MRKGCRVISAIFAVIMLLSASCFSAFSAENHYYIKELNLSLDLPDDMLAITRESPETDRYFSIFGLDYATTMSNFTGKNIYLQGMYEDSSRIFTVTMLTDEHSQRVGNYSDLSDEQLLDVENSFLAEKEYTSCTVKRYNSYVFMELQFKTQTDGETVYATQSNTVIDGNNITFALQPARGSELTEQDYQTMNNILQSVEFDGYGEFELENLIQNPIFLIIATVVILLIVIVVISIIRKKINKRRKDIKKEEKRIKNQEILKELAKEYSSQPVVSENSYTQDRSSEEEPMAEDNTEPEEVENIPLITEDNPVLRVITPEEIPAQNLQFITEDDFDATQEEYEQEDDENNEYPLIGSEESFDQGEDYFDEVPDEEIYSRETVNDEDNYERPRISRVDRDAVKTKAKTAGAVALNGVLIFLNGVKTFFIHLGYFCTNLYRLIKRKINRYKRRKAEMQKRKQQEEAKRRREENLRRKQQNIKKDANGLVQVRSRSEYPRQNSSRNRK